MSRRLVHLVLLVGLGCLFAGLPAAHAYQITDARAVPAGFSPNGDGIKDTTFFTCSIVGSFSLGGGATTLVVTDSAGAPVATVPVDSSMLVNGQLSVPWNGTSSATHAVVPEGAYTLTYTWPGGGAGVGVQAVVDLHGPVISNVSIQPNPLVRCLERSDGTHIDNQVVVRFNLDGFDSSPHSGDALVIKVLRAPGGGTADQLIDAAKLTFSGDTVQFVWQPDSSSTNTSANSTYPLQILAQDLAGNTSGGSLWGIQVVTSWPTMTLVRPRGRDFTVNGDKIAFLPAYPDSLVGLVFDPAGVRDMTVQIGTGAVDPVTLTPFGADSLRWAIPLPASMKNENIEYTVKFLPTNIYGCGKADEATTFHFQFDLSQPNPVQFFHPVPTVVHLATMTVGGSVSTNSTSSTSRIDSVLADVIRPDGTVFRAHKVIPDLTTTFLDTLELVPGIDTLVIQCKSLPGTLGPRQTFPIQFIASSGLTAPQTFHSGDAFLARVERPVASLEVRIYRPDGGFVRRIYSSTPTEPGAIEAAWDLSNESGTPVGRGPYVCTMRLTYADGTTESRRLAVVVMP